MTFGEKTTSRNPVLHSKKWTVSSILQQFNGTNLKIEGNICIFYLREMEISTVGFKGASLIWWLVLGSRLLLAITWLGV